MPYHITGDVDYLLGSGNDVNFVTSDDDLVLLHQKMMLFLPHQSAIISKPHQKMMFIVPYEKTMLSSVA